MNILKRFRREICVVLFAGCGGSSVGIAGALGEDPHLALNHDDLALAVHAVNHPDTVHLVEDVRKSPPRNLVCRNRVGLLWASPDCTHFSKAKGSKPKDKGIRALAEVIVDWAREVRPRVIIVENVTEFLDWGPLYELGHVLADGTLITENHPLLGQPIPERKGEYFRRWHGHLIFQGYKVEWKELDASAYGARTRRKRLFIVARCDGEPITWPAPTHGTKPGLQPLRTAAECIDWSLPVSSIFLSERAGRAIGVNRPLADNTMWRIAEGTRKFVLESPRPFIVHIDHKGSSSTGRRVDEPLSTIVSKNRHAVVAPTLIQTGYGERHGQEARVPGLDKPMGTIMATGRKHALVAAFLSKHYGGNMTPGSALGSPMDTITARDHNALTTASLHEVGAGDDVLWGREDRTRQVRAFLTTYYGEGSVGQRLDRPMRTITGLARMGLVVVAGVEYQISDIGMRMLEPHELLLAQFGRYAAGFDMSLATSKAKKVRLIGNSVCPELAEVLVGANYQPDGMRQRRAA